MFNFKHKSSKEGTSDKNIATVPEQFPTEQSASGSASSAFFKDETASHPTHLNTFKPNESSAGVTGEYHFSETAITELKEEAKPDREIRFCGSFC